MTMKLVCRIAIASLLVMVLLMYSQLFQPINSLLAEVVGFKNLAYGRGILESLLHSVPLLLFLWVVYANLSTSTDRDNVFVGLNVSPAPPIYKGSANVPKFEGILIILAVCIVAAIAMAGMNVVVSFLRLADVSLASGAEFNALLAETLFHASMAGLIIYVSLLFFNKRQGAPAVLSAFIGFQVLGCLGFVLWLSGDVNLRAPATEWLHALMLNCFTAFIWIPYLLTSERVERTFVVLSDAKK